MKLTKQQENCPYCHTDKSLIEYEDCGFEVEAGVDDDGTLYVDADDGYHLFNQEININYCPICGRPLNEEEE